MFEFVLTVIVLTLPAPILSSLDKGKSRLQQVSQNP